LNLEVVFCVSPSLVKDTFCCFNVPLLSLFLSLLACLSEWLALCFPAIDILPLFFLADRPRASPSPCLRNRIAVKGKCLTSIFTMASSLLLIFFVAIPYSLSPDRKDFPSVVISFTFPERLSLSPIQCFSFRPPFFCFSSFSEPLRS